MNNEVTKTVNLHITLDPIIEEKISLTEAQWDEIKEINGKQGEPINMHDDPQLFFAICNQIGRNINLAEYIDEIKFVEIDGERVAEE